MATSKTSSDIVTTNESVVNLDTGEIVSMVPQNADDQIAALKNPADGIFTTFTADSFEDKLKLFAAINESTPVSDNLNLTIQLAHVVAQSVEYRDTDGVFQTGTRLVLIDADGSAYSAMSAGLYTSVMNIIAILGHPGSWPKPFACKVVQKSSRTGGFKFFTIIPA